MNNGEYRFFFPAKSGSWPIGTEIKLINEDGYKWEKVQTETHPTSEGHYRNGNFICRVKLPKWVERKNFANNTYWETDTLIIEQILKDDKIKFLGYMNEPYSTLQEAKDSFE
jgi:hypothetical protein